MYKGCSVCGNKETVGFKLLNGVHPQSQLSEPLCLSCILYKVPFGVVVIFDARTKGVLAEEAIKISAEQSHGLSVNMLNVIAEKYRVLIVSRLHDKTDPCLYIKGPMLGAVFATDEIQDELGIMLAIEW